ncbi:MAG TPA: choice-of-anchor tandem repeat GloVer-containing protein [Terriglobia bacterium]|nr:choice-of-anchor tandem repeat GloVer-containing protein [Terriglobia bacterium]
MSTSKESARSAIVLTIVAMTLTSLIAPKWASSQTETVIHAFQSSNKYDGSSPDAPVIADSKGALYGTTATGGKHGWGTVFKLTPPTVSGGAWTESILYSFTGGNDGGQPGPGPLLLKGGSLYGTTSDGGANQGGVVFELSPGKPWVETVLYAFATGSGGFTPSSGLTEGSDGTYYGTTFKGGAHSQGVVYRLSPPTGGGAWTEAPIYAFQGGSTDGSEPGNNLILAGGSLYGVTLGGSGTAFKLTHSGSGPWTETILHTFNPAIEGPPNAAMVFDSGGALYGVTTANGASAGTVFQLIPPTGGGAWTKNTLYSFQGSPDNDGATPTGAIFDAAGALVGSTQYGGTNSNCGVVGCGTIFTLTPPSEGSTWTEQVVYSFLSGSDGEYPTTQLLLLGTTFYGETGEGGGQANAGTVFSFVP